MAVYARLDAFVVSLEQRLGRLTPLAVGVLALGLATLCVAPRTVPLQLGQFYAWFSLDPFGHSAENPVAFRPLTPLLSWAIGLRGVNLMYTNLGLTGLLLGCVYAWFRRHSPRPGDALVATGALAFSAVTFNTLFSPFYCDAFTYLVIFGMWCARKRPSIFYALFALGLFNRESLVFVVPWLALIALWESPSRLHTLSSQAVGYGLGLALYLGFREWMASRGAVHLDLAYYLDPFLADPLHFFRKTARYQWAGLYSVFGAAWAIPVAGAVSMWQRGDRVGPLGMAVLLLAVWSQLWIAIDTTRLLTLAFPVMLVALEELFRTGALRFREWAPWVLLLQALSPQVHTASNLFFAMDSLWTALVWR